MFAYLRVFTVSFLSISTMLGIALAEEQSLLMNAIVSDEFAHPDFTGNRNSVISEGFKSMIFIND